MTEITSKERVDATFRGEYLDRVPLYTNCFITGYITEKLGISRMEVLTEPEKEFQAFKQAQEEFPSDILRVPGDPLSPEGAEARRELKMGSGSPPATPYLQDKSNLKNLINRSWDPHENKNYKPYLEMTARVKDMYPDCSVMALAPGPWSNGVALRSAEAFVYDTVDDPDFVREVMAFTTKLAILRADALGEYGADMLVLGDPSAGCSLISPKIYKEFVKPFHHEIAAHFEKIPDKRIGIHICGYTDPIMEEIVTLPLDWFEIDSPSSLEKMKGIAGQKMAIKGNVSTEVFFEGTAEEMEASVKACIDIGSPGGYYIFSPGCRIPWNMNPDSMRVFMNTAYAYGSVENFSMI